MASVDAARALAGVSGGAVHAGDMAADAVRLRELPGTQYTATDARRLLEIVQGGPPELTAGLPRRIRYDVELDLHLGNLADPTTSAFTFESAGREVERFLATWRHNELTPAARADELRRLRGLPAAEYAIEDWRSLDAALNSSPPQTMPYSLPGMREPIANYVTAAARGYGTGEHVRHLQRIQDAWNVAEMSADEVQVVADRLRATPAVEYTTRDWAMLEALRGSGVYASRIDIPARVWSTTDLDRLLPHYSSGQWTKPEREIMRYMSAWRAASLSDDELLEATRALIARDPASFDGDDWRALMAIFDANDLRGDILRVPTEPASKFAYDFRQLVARQEEGLVRYHPDALRHHFAEWMPRLDRTWEARTRAAMNAAAEGRPATFEPNMPTAIANFDGESMWGRTGVEHVRLAVALLRNGELSTSTVVETPLALLSSGLDEVEGLAPQLQQLRDDTQGLVEHNLAVIEGRVPSSGYRNEPDYAHVGRIAANAELIERAISTPHVAAPPVIDPDAAKLAETLAW